MISLIYQQKKEFYSLPDYEQIMKQAFFHIYYF